jgi:hypothetical protein
MPATAERLAILAKARAVRRDKYEKIRELQAFIPKNPVGRPKLRGEKIDLVDKFINQNADRFVFNDEDITKDDEDITEHTENNGDNGNYEDNQEIVEIVEKVPKKKKIIRKIIKYVEEDDDDNDDELLQYTNKFANYNQNQYLMSPNDITPKQMIYNEFPVNTNKQQINFFNY